MTDDEKAAKGLAHLEAAAELQGIGVLRFPDSYLLLVTRAGAMQLVAAMNSNGQDKALVLVKHGPDVDSPETNN